MHSIIYPYKMMGAQRLPIVPVVLFGRQQSTKTEAYVDSGAFCSIFGMRLAREIGIDPREGQWHFFKVGDGNTITGYVLRVPVQIGDHKFRAPIAFSDELKVGFNLLGRRGIFTAFDAVIFWEKRGAVEFRLNQ